MRSLFVILLSLAGFSLFAQEDDVVPYTWTAEKSNNSWKLFCPDDSLSHVIEVDSVVITSAGELLEMGFVVIKNGKYALFSSFMKDPDRLTYDYDSIFAFGDRIYFKKSKNWTYCSVTDELEKYAVGKNPEYKFIGKAEAFYTNAEGVFYWRDGKQGLVSGNDHIQPHYKYVRLLQAGYDETTYLVSDGKKFGLLKGTQEVIPVGSPAIEHYSHGWFRFWVQLGDTAGYWDYLSPDNRIVRTHGNDLRVYSETIYKLYNADRSRAQIFRSHHEFLSGYEDYFFLDENLFSVRRNGKIGLVNGAGQVLFEPKYEQVESLDSVRLKVLVNGKWFLANYKGELLSKTGFGAIQHFQFIDLPGTARFGNERTFVINDVNGMGVMNVDGEVIISPNYSRLSKMGKFFVGFNGTNVVYNEFGKKVSEKNYPNYSHQLGDYVVMRDEKGLFDILSAEGKVNQVPFERFVQYPGAFKCYSKTALELIVMSEDNPAHVEEVQRYTLDNTVEIQQLDSLRFWSALWGIPQSNLEETQLNGNWNLRNTKTAQNNKANWIDVSYVGGSEVFAVTRFQPTHTQMAFGTEMNAYCSGKIVNYLDWGSGTGELISSTQTQHFIATKSSWDNIDVYPDGTQHWRMNENKHKGIDANAVFAIDHCIDEGYAATIANSAEIAENSEGVDLFSWFKSKNDFCNLSPAASTISAVMDPKMKIAPVDVKVVIRNTGKDDSPYLKNNTYAKFVSLGSLWSSDERRYIAKQFNSDTAILFSYRKDSAVIKDYFDIHLKQQEFAITESILPHIAFRHPSEPDFIFDPSDSVNRNKTFVYGRIVEQSAGLTVLKSVRDEVIFSSQGTFTAIDNGLFYINEGEKAFVIDRNGEKLADLKAGTMRTNGEAGFIVESADSVYWYSGEFKQLNAARTGNLTQVIQDHWLIERVDERTIYNETGMFVTSLFEGEIISQSGWLMNKTEDGFVYRFPEKKTSLLLKSRPEETQYLLFSKQKDYQVAYNTNGDLVIDKKRKFRSKNEKGSFVIFSNQKAFLVLDEFGNVLYEGDKYKSAEELDDVLYLETKDTVLQLKSGTGFAETEETPELNSSDWKMGMEEIVELPRKKGAAFYYGKAIVPAIYDNVFITGRRFLVVQSGNSYYTYEVGVGFVRLQRSAD